LFDYMRTRRSEVMVVGDIYDTPNNQSITARALDTLLYSDFSIYELCPEYSVTVFPTTQKSLFTLRCYSVAEWEEGRPGDQFSPTEYSPTLESVFQSHINLQRSQSEVLELERIIIDNNNTHSELITMLNGQLNGLYSIEDALQSMLDATEYFNIQS